MAKKHNLAAGLGLTFLGLGTAVSADTVSAWGFEAYGGFSALDTGFPEPGYNVLLTPLTPREHRDMGAFHWSMSSIPSLLGINQKKPLIHGQSWKAPGQYYSEKFPVRPGLTSIHGEVIGEIVTDDAMGQVIGWLTHYNKPIPETFEGARTAVNYHLRMIDPGTGAQAWDSGEMFFVIDVLETNNYTVCCPDGNENGTPPNQSGCADRFRVGILADYDGDGDIDADDLLSAPVGSSFDEEVDTFTYRGVEYSVRLSGFWEAGEEGPVLKGEGWSPEYDFTHFEVRAEVWAGEAGKSREKESDASEEAPRVSCEPA